MTESSHLPAIVKKNLPCILLVAALLVFSAYLARNARRYRDLLNLSAGSLLSLLGLVLCFAASNGLINFLFFRMFDVYMTLNESIGLAAVNTLANQLPFAGGLVAKAAYLKQRHSLAYTHFLSATTALYVCFVATNGVIGIAVLGSWWLTDLAEIPLPLVLGFLGMTLSFVALWLPVDAVSFAGGWGRHLERLTEGWAALGQHLPLAGILIILQTATTLIFASRLWIVFHVLSQDVTYAQCLLFSAATILTRLVSIAPGGLGVREGIVAGVASLLGFEAGVSAVAVGLDRIIATSVILVLGTVYTYVLSSKVADTERAESTTTGE
jgi:uncharacterized membrane protein YbhN (UPF0104 family)